MKMLCKVYQLGWGFFVGRKYLHADKIKIPLNFKFEGKQVIKELEKIKAITSSDSEIRTKLVYELVQSVKQYKNFKKSYKGLIMSEIKEFNSYTKTHG